MKDRDKWDYPGLYEDFKACNIAIDHNLFPVDGGQGDQPAGFMDKVSATKAAYADLEKILIDREEQKIKHRPRRRR